MPMRYVVYLRVSTEGQVDDGQGLAVQEQAAREWIRRGRHRLVEICTDAGLSGALDVGGRPGLAQALSLIGADRADGLLVHRLDRLARDLILQEQLLAELHRRGKELHSCSPSEDANLEHAPDDPARALTRQILGAVAQYDRANIRLRLMRGRALKKLAGGYAGGGPPFGYAAIRGQLVKIPDEQAAIRRMVSLRRQGASLREIGARLEAEGIRSRAPHGKWRPATIMDILRREELRRGGSRNVVATPPPLVEVNA